MDFVTKAGRELAKGDILFRPGVPRIPVKELAYANGLDGKERRMIGGPGTASAFAVRVVLEDDSEVVLHPGQEVKVWPK